MIMNRDEEQIDNLIRQALTEEEIRFYNDLEEQNLFGKLEQLYRGKLGKLTMAMNVFTFLLFGIFVFALVRFLDAGSATELIVWASLGFLSILAVSMLKLFVWMQMDKNDLKREMKRIELQIAALSTKMERKLDQGNSD
jgi:hypothetical protein